MDGKNRREVDAFVRSAAFAGYLLKPRTARAPGKSENPKEARGEFVPLAVLAEELARAIGAKSRVLRLTDRVADKMWRRHGPGARKARGPPAKKCAAKMVCGHPVHFAGGNAPQKRRTLAVLQHSLEKAFGSGVGRKRQPCDAHLPWPQKSERVSAVCRERGNQTAHRRANWDYCRATDLAMKKLCPTKTPCQALCRKIP